MNYTELAPVFSIINVVLTVAILIVLVTVVITCLGHCQCKNDPSIKSDPPTINELEQRTEVRKDEEISERENVMSAIKNYIDTTDKYVYVNPLHNLGCRLQKYWMEVMLENKPLILTAAPLPPNCSLSMDNVKFVDTMNLLLKELNKHPFLHEVYEVAYISEMKLVIIIQNISRQGSLRDVIHKQIAIEMESDENDRGFDMTWTKKKNNAGIPLSTEDVALYGRQILKTITFFYKNGFPFLGHIHTGNIFIVDGICKLGGYENMLLGYKSKLYKICAEEGYLDDIDIIMFGHVIFEMGTGRPAPQLILTDEDYQSVEDEGLKKALKFIFFENTPGKMKNSIKKISKFSFFKDVSYNLKIPKMKITKEMRKLYF